MERFGKLALQIQDLNPEVALHHMVTALHPRSFADSLWKKPVSDLDELRKRVGKFMQLEKLREFQNQVRAELAPEKTKARGNRPPPSHCSQSQEK